MKRETLHNFLLSCVLAGICGVFGLIWNFRDRLSDVGERLARIETKVESLSEKSYAKMPSRSGVAR